MLGYKMYADNVKGNHFQMYNPVYEPLTRVRVRARYKARERGCDHWIPNDGEVVILLTPVPRGTWDVAECLRHDGRGEMECIYGLNIIRALPRDKNPPVLLYTFDVYGKGRFPFDMLSRNQCFPETDQEAAKLFSDWNRQKRQIKLRGLKPPILEEWRTCLWPVMNKLLDVRAL